MRGINISATRRRVRGRARGPRMEQLESRRLLSVYTVTSTVENSAGGLGNAILSANAHPGADTIDFNIGGGGPATLSLTSALPTITGPLTIDGTSQPGFTGPPLIGISGNQLSSGDGLSILASGTVIKSLAIVGFAKGDGIKIDSNNVTVVGCNIGVDQSGSSAQGNKNGIEVVNGRNNVIGGTGTLDPNMIAGNTQDGIHLDSSASLTNIFGNYIGTDRAGASPIPNGNDGIYLQGSLNRIGGDQPGQGNVIGGNGTGVNLGKNGIEIDQVFGGTGNNTIEGNKIGVSADGTRSLGNQKDGIYITGSSGNTIGGSTAGAANVIGSNGQDVFGGHGIEITFGKNTLIQGNYIGTDTTGKIDLGNMDNGILIAGSVFGNSGGTKIGGSLTGAGNVIAFNGKNNFFVKGNGISITDANAQGVSILSNSIYSNTDLGIDLGGDGVTPNDPLDADTGPNGLQNFPTITSASTAAGRTQIVGMLNSTPGSQFLIQFFSSPQADPTGFGEGKTLLGSTKVTTDNLGTASFKVTLAAPSNVGDVVTATATTYPADTGSTSEFSQAVTLAQGKVSDISVSVSDNPDPATTVRDLSSYALQVVNWGDGSSVPTSGQDLVVVGIDTNGLLHIRIFNGSGKMIVNMDETQADANRSSVIKALKQQIPSLLGQNLTSVQQAQVINQVMQIEETGVTYTTTVRNSGPTDATNAQFTQSLPGAALAPIISTTQGSLSIVNGSVQGNLGTIAAASTVTITITVFPNAAGTISTTASAQADQIDVNMQNNTATQTTDVVVPSDLSVTIAPASLPVIQGQRQAFVALITNHGPGLATGVNFDATLPASVKPVDAFAGQGTVAYNGQSVHASLGTMAKGVTVAVRLLVIPNDLGTLSFDGSLSFDEVDLDPTNNTATASATVVPNSDLGVVLTPDKHAMLSGQDLTLSAHVINNGPSDASNVIVTFPVPANSKFVSATGTQGSPASVSPNGQTVTLNLGTIASGGSADVTIIITPTKGGTLKPSISVASDSGDTVSTNNTSTTTVVVNAANLNVTQSATPNPADLNANLTYTLAVHNNGPADATNVTLYDQLPVSVKYVSTSSPGGSGTYDSQTGIVTIPVGTVRSGQTVLVGLTVTPSTSATILNTVVVSADQTDPDQTNNTSTYSLNVSPADLAVNTSASTSSILAGDSLTYSVVVTNHGPSTAPNVQFSQSVPANARVVSVQSTQGSISNVNGKLTGTLGNLASGASATVTLMVVPLQGGSADSTATASSDLLDSDPSNNTGTALVTVTNQPGSIQFSSPLYQAPENGGHATLTLTRTNGTQGSVSVTLSTVADATAQPGVNFSPVTETVTFAPGETSKTVSVPVMSDGKFEPYTYLHVKLSNPSGGASLGSQPSTILAIMNTDVDTTPLTVASTSLIASGTTTFGVVLTFNKALDPVSASAPGEFFVIGPNGIGLPLQAQMYNPANNSVTIVPATPLTAPGFYTVVVNGAPAAGLKDYHGTPLSGAGTAGTNYVESFARGASLVYGDATGNLVNLRLSRGGLLEMFRNASGNSQVLNVLAPPGGRSVLSGSVGRLTPTATGSTSLGQVNGLGLSSSVRSALTTPPFFGTTGLGGSLTASAQTPVRQHRPIRVAQTPVRQHRPIRVAGTRAPWWIRRGF